MAPRDPPHRHSVEHPPRPVPKRDIDRAADVDVLERPSRESDFDEPARDRDGGFDPSVNSVPR